MKCTAIEILSSDQDGCDANSLFNINTTSATEKR